MSKHRGHLDLEEWVPFMVLVALTLLVIAAGVSK